MAAAKAAPKAFHWGTGRRKTAVARVRMSEGSGLISINGRTLDEYFTEEKDRAAVLGPLLLFDMRTRLDLFITTKGGGFTGQSGAINQGIARALKLMFNLQTTPAAPVEGAEPVVETAESGLAKKLRDSGYLTRDGRMKERKHYGRKGARRGFQFSKR